MIFYFSGTGNSKHVASVLATQLNEQLIEVGHALVHEQYRYALQADERLGFVFPIYSWGPPPVILELLNHLHLQGYGNGNHTFMVATCGDDTGCTVDIFKKHLHHKGIELQAAFSIQMPNNYVNMKGFDVDSDTLRNQKLQAAQARIMQVAQLIAERRLMTDVVTGAWPWAKSHIVRPWFVRHAMSDKKFRVDSALCTHCGACVRHCPLHNITLNARQEPLWNGRCAMCLSCLHRCPARAIQYGNATQNKGRYYYAKKP